MNTTPAARTTTATNRTPRTRRLRSRSPVRSTTRDSPDRERAFAREYKDWIDVCDGDVDAAKHIRMLQVLEAVRTQRTEKILGDPASTKLDIFLVSTFSRMPCALTVRFIKNAYSAKMEYMEYGRTLFEFDFSVPDLFLYCRAYPAQDCVVWDMVNAIQPRYRQSLAVWSELPATLKPVINYRYLLEDLNKYNLYHVRHVHEQVVNLLAEYKCTDIDMDDVMRSKESTFAILVEANLLRYRVDPKFTTQEDMQKIMSRFRTVYTNNLENAVTQLNAVGCKHYGYEKSISLVICGYLYQTEFKIAPSRSPPAT